MQDGRETDPNESLVTRSGRVAGADVALFARSSKADVWELAFSPDGDVLAAASSDGSIVLWQINWSDDVTSCSETTPTVGSLELLCSTLDFLLRQMCLATSVWAKLFTCCKASTDLLTVSPGLQIADICSRVEAALGPFNYGIGRCVAFVDT